MSNIHRLAPPKPVPAEGGLPAGVTVRAYGDKPTEPKPRNLLEQSAMLDDFDLAISRLLAALVIKPGNVMKANLPTAKEWARLPVPARLEAIGDWIRAECFECMDFVEFSKPVDMTIGD